MTNELIYGAYILIWPALTLCVLTAISWAVFCDARNARQAQNGVTARVQERLPERVQVRAHYSPRDRRSEPRAQHNHTGHFAG